MQAFPEVYIDLSMPEHSTFDSALSKMYYRNDTLLSLAPSRSGFPSNGGEHTMHIKGSRKECRAFLDLVKETYPFTTPEVIVLQIRIDAGDRNIRLRDIK